MEIKVASSQYDVLLSGSVITFDENSNISFSCKLDEDSEFTMVIKFESDNTDKTRTKSSLDGDTITLTCYNFDSRLGIGTKSAAELAEYNGKTLFFNFCVTKLGEVSPRMITYCFYSER